MPHWYLKAATQGMIALLPGAERLNTFLKEHVFRTLAVDDDALARKWERVARHLRNYRTHAPRPRDAPAVLELGTGWYPTVPVGVALMGARRVYTIDKVSLLSRERTLRVLRFYDQAASEGRIPARPEPLRALREVLARPDRHTPATSMLMAVGVYPLVGDAQHTGLAPGAMDLVISNNTFAHIPPGPLTGIFREFRRVVAPGGAMSHLIDMADQYHNFDTNISVYNFLRYGDRAWRIWSNRLQYVNRLRLPDYLRLHAEAGFRVTETESREGTLEELRQIPLAPRFRHYDEADLLPYESWVTSVPAGSQG